MTHSASLTGLALCVLLLAVGPALADPEILSTAQASSAGSAAPAASASAPPSVADQIDTYLKTSPAVLPTDGAVGVTPGEEPRKVHGEVDLAVGTGGYRSAYARSDFPVGKTGTLSIAVQDSRINLRGGPIQHQGLALGLSFMGTAADGIEPWRRRACEERRREGPAGAMMLDGGPPLACPMLDSASAPRSRTDEP